MGRSMTTVWSYALMTLPGPSGNRCDFVEAILGVIPLDKEDDIVAFGNELFLLS